jgi:hypothetical protein
MGPYNAILDPGASTTWGFHGTYDGKDQPDPHDRLFGTDPGIRVLGPVEDLGAAGVGTASWDRNFTDPSIARDLGAAEVGLIRYPGGSWADEYFWQTNTAKGENKMGSHLAFEGATVGTLLLPTPDIYSFYSQLPDGSYAVVLVNASPSEAASLKVSDLGFSGTPKTRHVYDEAHPTITSAAFSGSRVQVPAESIVVLTDAEGSAPRPGTEPVRNGLPHPDAIRRPVPLGQPVPEPVRNTRGLFCPLQRHERLERRVSPVRSR